uniref:Uncharacterized protein n=1 Tax=Arundo donax TaxID=35708 RepID=A0A0A9GXA4_ARUDO
MDSFSYNLSYDFSHNSYYQLKILFYCLCLTLWSL